MTQKGARKTSSPEPPPTGDTQPLKDGYKVGPGRPPREHQWRRGQSGNPKGRKRREPSMEPALKAALERALSGKVTLTKGQRQYVVTCGQAGMEQLATQFARGDRHARRDILTYAEKLGVQLVPDPGGIIDRAIMARAHAALDAYVARCAGAKELSATAPVLAPPELLDGDPEE